MCLCHRIRVRKTRTALTLLDAFVAKNEQSQALIVVPTKALKDQGIDKIDEMGLQFNARVEIVNTVITKDWTCDLLVVDECHLFASDTFQKTFERVQYKFVLCLTGTLVRLDGKEVIIKKYAPVCDEITYEEAVDNSGVSKVNEYCVMLEVDLTEYNELTRKFNNYFAYFNGDFNLAMTVATNAVARNRGAKQMGLDSKKTAAIALDWMRVMRKRKDFVTTHPKKIEVARKILEARKKSKCITFSATIKMAEDIGGGYVLHSKQSKKKNEEVMEKFNSEKVAVLHSSKAANQGIDVPGLEVGIILSTDSSKITKQQRKGRIARIEENKVPELFTLVIKGTQEVNGFNNSKTSKVITINEEQLDKVLAGEQIETRERNYTENLQFRF